MSRTKAANETKLKEGNAAEGSKGLVTAQVTPGTSKSQTPDAAFNQQVQPSIFSTREDLNPSPAIKRSVSERVTPTSPQQIPNVFRQSFQAAQSTDATTVQQLSLQQSSQTALPPLNTQLHGTSRLPYQVTSSAHPLRINTNAINQGGNASPVQSMSAGPWSYSTSKGPGVSSSVRGAPDFSQGSQRIPESSTPVASDPPVVPPNVPESDRAPAAGNKCIGQTQSLSSSVPHNNAGDVISSRLGILYLSDSDKEDVITNLQNLARMYPDVTLSQLVDPHMELPRAKIPGLSSGLEREQDEKSHGVFQSTNAHDTSPAPASAITADASFPIAFVAYSREPQPMHRTYTSPVAGPNPSFGAPPPSSSFDYQSRHHSTSNASITSIAIQTTPDRTRSSSFSARRQDSTGTQTYSPQTRSELAQTAWGLKPGFATTEGPGMATAIPARPATTAPTQAFDSSPDALGTQPSRQHSVSRKPLSSQSPIMNRPYRSLSWQPRDHSPNPQLPSSLVSEVPEEPSTPPPDIAQHGSLLASASSNVHSEGALRPTTSESAEAPLQQLPQGNSETDQKEFDRLNSIIKEQNKQLALLYQQNVQNLQGLQSQQNASVLHQVRQLENIGHQRNPSVPASQSTRGSIYTQSSLQNTHYPPSYPSVPVSPISRPESLVYSIREEPRPLSLPEPAFDQDVGKPGDIERISETNSVLDDDVEVNANLTSDALQQFGKQHDQTPMFQNNITQDNIEQEPGVDDKEVVSHQQADTANEMSAAAASVGGRSESRGSNQTESKRESWSHVRTHSATQQILGQDVLQGNTNVRDRSESPGSNQTESKRGSWSHVRTHSATHQVLDQTVRQIAVADVDIPPSTSASVQTADFLVEQEISNTSHQIYHKESRQVSNQGPQQHSLQDNVPPQEIQSAHIVQIPAQPPTQLTTIQEPLRQVSDVLLSNDQRLPSHQRQSSQPRMELKIQQNYVAQANPAYQSQPQPAQSYQTPNIMVSIRPNSHT